MQNNNVNTITINKSSFATTSALPLDLDMNSIYHMMMLCKYFSNPEITPLHLCQMITLHYIRKVPFLS